MMPKYLKSYPYAKDAMNLPVTDVEAAIPFYTTIMGFKLMSQSNTPHKSAVLARDDIQMAIAENGGDPTQEGCFFEVDNVEAAFAELKANGLQNENPNYRIDDHGETKYKVFFVIAPDGLCYCIGEKQE